MHVRNAWVARLPFGIYMIVHCSFHVTNRFLPKLRQKNSKKKRKLSTPNHFFNLRTTRTQKKKKKKRKKERKQEHEAGRLRLWNLQKISYSGYRVMLSVVCVFVCVLGVAWADVYLPAYHLTPQPQGWMNGMCFWLVKWKYHKRKKQSKKENNHITDKQITHA